MNNYCIISHEYKFIYIPIAKVACTTLMNRIAEIIYGPEINTLGLKSHRDVHSRRKEIFNSRYSEISQSIKAVKKYPKYFKFSFTRNPYDRIHSCYIDKLSIKSYGFDQNLISRYDEMYRGMSFINFLKVIKSMPLEKMDEHFRPQYSFLPVKHLDFIGKLEAMDTDWKTVEKYLGVRNIPLQVYNKTEKDNLLSPEADELIIQIYKKDFELFGYSRTHPQYKISDHVLPLKITADSDADIHPFKDVFLKNNGISYEITVTGNDPQIIIPYFSLRPGKGILFQSTLVSPIATVFTLYYTSNDALTSLQACCKTIPLAPGENNISIQIDEPNLAGRLRFTISNIPEHFEIKNILITEQTLPWFEDPEDLTEVTKRIFSLPKYVQKQKNLSSMVNYASLYLPILQILQPSHICEIGSEQGNNAHFLADFCQDNNAELIIIDPDTSKLNGLTDHNNIHIEPMKSVEYLRRCSEASDAYFIDGDHNYQTVSLELDLIAELARKTPKPVCIFIHDISWPWAYRDLYYNPEDLNIPDENIAKDSMTVSLYSSLPSQIGLPSTGYNFSTRENGPKNGVKKALEDFLLINHDWRCIEISSIFGIAVMWQPERLTADQEIAFKTIESHFSFFKEFLSILEWNRLALICRISQNAQTWKQNQEYIKKLQDKIRGLMNK